MKPWQIILLFGAAAAAWDISRYGTKGAVDGWLTPSKWLSGGKRSR